MGINQEMVILCTLILVATGFFVICLMMKKINELMDEICHLRELGGIRCDSIKSHCKLIEHIVGELETIVDELIDDVCEWTPEPEEELKPGEVQTLDELTIEVNEDPIHLITPNQFFFENNNYNQINLEYASDTNELRYWYYDGGVEEYIVVDNVDQCIGEGLKFFGVNSKDDRVVYVRNNIFNADFRIVKVS